MSTETITDSAGKPADTITGSAGKPAIAQGQWWIDPARSQVEFRTPTLWGLATVRGHFDRYEGSLDLKRTPAIELTIDASSLDTNNSFRDKHLRSSDFLDVANHPQVRFVSDSAALDGEKLKVRGQLYAGGSNVPIELEARVRAVGDELEIDASTSIDHRRLGMSAGTLGMINKPAELIVHGRLVR